MKIIPLSSFTVQQKVLQLVVDQKASFYVPGHKFSHLLSPPPRRGKRKARCAHAVAQDKVRVRVQRMRRH